jgi:hypothetical protein
VDYCLDAGDGTASMWSGPADLDLDGDGLFDDVLVDDNGDGLADHATLDLDDDGTPEAGFTDDGSGSWSVSGGAERQLRWLSLDGVEHTGPGDVDGDGVTDRLLDIDRDGLADRALSGDSGYVDTDGDGLWDLRLMDSDGDGTADAAGPL